MAPIAMSDPIANMILLTFASIGLIVALYFMWESIKEWKQIDANAANKKHEMQEVMLAHLRRKALSRPNYVDIGGGSFHKRSDEETIKLLSWIQFVQTNRQAVDMGFFTEDQCTEYLYNQAEFFGVQAEFKDDPYISERGKVFLGLKKAN